MTQQSARLRGEPAPRDIVPPPSRMFSAEIVQSNSHQTNDPYRYQQHGPSLPNSMPAPPQVPVLLCHTCSECGRMRSTGYHRRHPVIPGKPIALTRCRRCRRKSKDHGRSSSTYTRIRSCTADEPCDWPRESIRIDIDRSEHRGRPRSREVYVRHHSPTRPPIIRQDSSQATIGLRVLQQDRSPPRVYYESKIRASSLSPRRAPRYGDIWPPPDVVRMVPSRSDEDRLARGANPNLTSRDEVWPPPDVVRTYSYNKAPPAPLRRQSSRIVELSPSPPPPTRTSSQRIVFRSQSMERRPRSVSPINRDESTGRDAAARLMSHPQPYRRVLPRERAISPERGILKSPGGDYETPQRSSMRESQYSTTVEVGGPRVHFDSERAGQPEEPRGRLRYTQDPQATSGDREPRPYCSQNPYIIDSATPPLEQLERMSIRRSPSRDEIRISRARRISPSPPRAPTSDPRRYEEVRIRRVSPPSNQRRRRSLTPPRARESASDDVTDTDSSHSGGITEVRTWKGIDENGRPATYVEERRSVRMLESASHNEGPTSVRYVSDRLGSRSWREV